MWCDVMWCNDDDVRWHWRGSRRPRTRRQSVWGRASKAVCLQCFELDRCGVPALSHHRNTTFITRCSCFTTLLCIILVLLAASLSSYTERKPRFQPNFAQMINTSKHSSGVAQRGEGAGKSAIYECLVIIIILSSAPTPFLLTVYRCVLVVVAFHMLLTLWAFLRTSSYNVEHQEPGL